MIRQTATINNKPIESLINYLDRYASVIDEEFNAAFNEVRPLLLDTLDVIPEHPHYPIIWQSERQRRAFFATDGFGGGIPYQRTGALQSSWVMEKTGGGAQFVVIVRNPTSYAKYVVGSLSKTNPGGFMQEMHKASGYIPAYKPVNYWLDVLWKTYTDNMFNRLGGVIGTSAPRTRAFTR